MTKRTMPNSETRAGWLAVLAVLGACSKVTPSSAMPEQRPPDFRIVYSMSAGPFGGESVGCDSRTLKCTFSESNGPESDVRVTGAELDELYRVVRSRAFDTVDSRELSVPASDRASASVSVAFGATSHVVNSSGREQPSDPERYADVVRALTRLRDELRPGQGTGSSPR